MGKKIDIDYYEPLSCLEELFTDKTRYVIRSVANHLNDISKIDPSLVIDTLKRWRLSGKQETKEMDYIINHSLRTLVKQGDEEALKLLGYIKNPAMRVSKIYIENKKVFIAESLEFSFALKAKEDARLMIDYILHFKTKRGALSQKVYKLKKINMRKGELVTLKKQHPFRANMTTRKLYQGEHRVDLQINGILYSSDTFMLME